MLFSNDKRACGCQQPGYAGAYEPEAWGAAGAGCGCGCECNACADPIVEKPIEKCIKKDICHEVQHICPVHTTVINNHIFRHTYVPQFTCSEENVITNLDQGSCCNFL